LRGGHRLYSVSEHYLPNASKTSNCPPVSLLEQ
jgi:hypothetical protein